MLANKLPKSVPGTRCGARPDASKQAAPHRCQAPGAAPGRMLANRVPKSVPGTRCGVGNNAAGYSVVVDATGTEVLLAFGDDPQTSRAVAEFVVRSLLSYSRP